MKKYLVFILLSIFLLSEVPMTMGQTNKTSFFGKLFKKRARSGSKSTGSKRKKSKKSRSKSKSSNSGKIGSTSKHKKWWQFWASENKIKTNRKLSRKKSLVKVNQHNLVFMAGTANFLGDLGGGTDIGGGAVTGIKDYNFGANRPAFSIGYRYRLLQQVALRTNLTYGYVSGSDELTTNKYRKNRNLKFRSPIVELNALVEIYPYSFESKEAKFLNLSPYAFMGVGLFYFNPQGPDSTGKWHDLQPLGTEGQGKIASREKYSLIQMCIPIGVGFEYRINKQFSVSFEFAFRITFTDYIDDVSTTYPNRNIYGNDELAKYFSNPSPTRDLINATEPDGMTRLNTAPGEIRGNPLNKDAYMFTMFTLEYKLGNAKRKSSSKF